MEIKQYFYRLLKESKRKLKILDTNGNQNEIIQNLWDAAKAVLREKFIAMQSHLNKQEKHQIDILTLYLEQL